MDLKQTTVPQLTPTLLTGSPEDLSSGGRPVLVVGPSLGTSVSALWGPGIGPACRALHGDRLGPAGTWAQLTLCGSLHHGPVGRGR